MTCSHCAILATRRTKRMRQRTIPFLAVLRRPSLRTGRMTPCPFFLVHCPLNWLTVDIFKRRVSGQSVTTSKGGERFARLTALRCEVVFGSQPEEQVKPLKKSFLQRTLILSVGVSIAVSLLTRTAPNKESFYNSKYRYPVLRCFEQPVSTDMCGLFAKLTISRLRACCGSDAPLMKSTCATPADGDVFLSFVCANCCPNELLAVFWSKICSICLSRASEAKALWVRECRGPGHIADCWS